MLAANSPVYVIAELEHEVIVLQLRASTLTADFPVDRVKKSNLTATFPVLLIMICITLKFKPNDEA